MRRQLIVFARAPVLGSGKRRLARDIGDVAALRFERAMMAGLLRRLGGDRRWRLVLALTPEHAVRQERRRRGVTVFGQGPGDLGRRMRRALDRAPPGPVVLIGTDIPALAPGHVAEAFRLLGRYDLVFGPAEDGGFWLVGARCRPLPADLFATVRWSSPHALADVRAGLPRRISVGYAAKLADIDDGAGYARFRRGGR